MPKDDKLIRGDVIKKGLKKLDYFDVGVRDILIKDIEQQGIVLDPKHYYSLKDIEGRFTYIFGNASSLLIGRLKVILGELKLLAVASLPTIQFGFICIASTCVCFISSCLGIMQEM